MTADPNTPTGARGAVRGDLHVHLDAALPDAVAVGAGTAVFVGGWCYAPRAPIHALWLVVDGAPQPVDAHGMPRLDVFRALHPGLDPYATAAIKTDASSPEDPLLLSYRSGFWAIATIAPGTAPAVCVVLRADLADGTTAEAPLPSMRRAMLPAPATVPPPAGATGPLVAVCMATFNPPAALFERQIASIRAQTHRNWVCVVSDDCSDARLLAQLTEIVGDDPRFVIDRSPERLGFYRNFERALALAPAGADHVAMADQDDDWYPEKLATLLRELGDAELIYSDARIVDAGGAVRAETYWQRRRNNHTDLLSLLVANAVTGAASLFPRDLLDDALPFPPAQFAHFHDHWVALVALARGRIAYHPRPLYDYVQHGEASLGHAAANRVTALRDRAAALRRDPRERVRMWRMHYFVDAQRLTQVATVLRLRLGGRMAPAKRRALDGYLRADSSALDVGRLWWRGARELVGRPETLGAEWMLAYAFTWRRALSASVRDRPVRGLRLDAVPPTTLAPAPGRRLPDGPARAIAAKIAPLQLAVRDDAPARVNILIPTIDLDHFFGGYIAKFNLARRLAERGLRVRIVTVDPVAPMPPSWQERVEGYAGLSGMFDQVEVAFGREAQGLEVSRADRFIASTWWSAHIADAAVRELGSPRFLYLIQEYEPFTFPMGTYAALAAESYTFAHTALFSTDLLRDWFRGERLGVFAGGEDAGVRASAAFQNAITAVTPPVAADLAGRRTRRLLFYARPEPHAARNMFELGVLALSRAVQDGALAGWELRGIGTLGGRRTLDLGTGARLELAARTDQRGYAQLLRDHDLGLALMHTPHPSLVPIEMASAGMLTVTNRYANKTPSALAAISHNLIAAEPSITGVAAALAQASSRADDAEYRAAGAHVDWSRDWDRSFDDDLLDRVVGLLELEP